MEEIIQNIGVQLEQLLEAYQGHKEKQRIILGLQCSQFINKTPFLGQRLNQCYAAKDCEIKFGETVYECSVCEVSTFCEKHQYNRCLLCENRDNHKSGEEASEEEADKEEASDEEETSEEEADKEEASEQEASEEEANEEEAGDEEETDEEEASDKEETDEEEASDEEEANKEKTSNEEEASEEEASKEEASEEGAGEEEEASKEEASEEEAREEEARKEEASEEEASKEEASEEASKEEAGKEEPSKEEEAGKEASKEEACKASQILFQVENIKDLSLDEVKFRKGLCGPEVIVSQVLLTSGSKIWIRVDEFVTRKDQFMQREAERDNEDNSVIEESEAQNRQNEDIGK